MKNIVLLKMLYAYHDQIDIHFEQNDDSSALLLLLPTHAFYYDAQTYPQTKYVVLFATNNMAAHTVLLEKIPTDCNIVFKLMDGAVKEAIATRFSLQRVTSFLSYTNSPDANFERDDEVTVFYEVDDECIAIFDAQGHPTATVRRQFASNEAVGFVLRQNGLPVSTCFAYRNYEPVWEVGGVWTDPQSRRGGFARRVVTTALHTLCSQRLIPRYQVHEVNQPSIRLAEALGLQRFVTMEHFLYTPQER